MFRIYIEEWTLIRSQNETAINNDDNMQSQIVTTSQKKRNIQAIT